MNESECNELIDRLASNLSIAHLVTEDFRDELYRQSDGHPYVIKILLGEVAKSGKTGKIERIVASKDEILNALFERTFWGLSPAGKRMFLTLCSWRSMLPQLAVEAVLLRPANEQMDVRAAIDELYKTSFIEIVVSPQDQTVFLAVPLAAAVFGQKKLTASPYKTMIDADREILLAFGAGDASSLSKGVSPRVFKLFKHIANLVTSGKATLQEHLPMLEFIARQFPPGWLLLASLAEEANLSVHADEAKEYLRRYIENTTSKLERETAWQRLAELCQRTQDWSGEAHALVEICEQPETDFKIISNAANRINALLKHNHLALDTEEKEIVVRNLVRIMVSRIEEADATDCSRLAWLFIRLGGRDGARKYAELGLERDPYNEYCSNLLLKLDKF
jgi:hypothetical protein